MTIKYFIAILCILASQVLSAQDTQIVKQRVKSKLSAPMAGAKNQVWEDSLMMVQNKDKQIFIPFGQNKTNSIASDIKVINPNEVLRYDNFNSVSGILGGMGLYGVANLRGLGSALIVIDGIPRTIDDVNLSEVEQITILKDANSAMFYGVQAKNGVILITTKRGQANKNKITVLVESGFGSPISFPKYLGSADYMKLYNEAQTNDGITPTYSQTLIDLTKAGNSPLHYPEANYYNSTFLKNFTPSSRVETEFSGGNKNAQYYTNLGWQRTGSLLNLGNFNDNRLNLRSNINARINDFITAHLDISSIFNISTVPTGDFFSDASTLLPNYYPPLIDTSMVSNKSLLKTSKVVMGKYILGGTSNYKNNPYGNFLLGGYTKQFISTTMFSTGVDVDLKSILKGLTLKTLVSFDYYGTYNQTQVNPYAVYEPKWFVDKAGKDSLTVTKIGDDKNTGTQGIANTTSYRSYTYYGILDYSHNFGKSSLSAAILAYYDISNMSGTFQSDKHAHLGGKIDYVYADKYILNFTSALVSSAKLSGSNRVGFSPSASVGWVVSQEEFLKNSSLVSYLKLSASGGIINTDMSLTKYYSYENVIASGGAYTWGDAFRTNNSMIFSNVANNQLFYEKRKEFNFGVEAAFLNNTLWVDANYFNDNRSDQIVPGLSNTIPGYLGSVNPSQNYNADKYSGLELGVNLKKSTGDFNFEIRPSLLYLETKAVKRDEFYASDYQYRVGKPVGAIFGLQSMGLFQNNEDIANSPRQAFGVVVPGDIKYKDQNDDKTIDANDEVMIGNSLSKFIGGLVLRVKYKNLSLFALGTCKTGAQIIYNSSYYWISASTKYSEVVLNRWTPATAATATYPRLSSKANSNNFRSSSFWIEGNALTNLDRVQLTYDLPQSLAKKLLTKNFSLYVRGSNLVNLAPNKDKMELNIGSEPQYRNYSAGLKVLF